VGSLFTITGRMNSALSWWTAKSATFILKFYLYLTMRKSDLSSVLSKYLLIMELHSDVMLYSYMGNKNSDTGHIKCSCRSHLACRLQVPQPCF